MAVSLEALTAPPGKVINIALVQDQGSYKIVYEGNVEDPQGNIKQKGQGRITFTCQQPFALFVGPYYYAGQGNPLYLPFDTKKSVFASEFVQVWQVSEKVHKDVNKGDQYDYGVAVRMGDGTFVTRDPRILID